MKRLLALLQPNVIANATLVEKPAFQSFPTLFFAQTPSCDDRIFSTRDPLLIRPRAGLFLLCTVNLPKAGIPQSQSQINDPLSSFASLLARCLLLPYMVKTTVGSMRAQFLATIPVGHMANQIPLYKTLYLQNTWRVSGILGAPSVPSARCPIGLALVLVSHELCASTDTAHGFFHPQKPRPLPLRSIFELTRALAAQPTHPPSLSTVLWLNPTV